MLFVIPLLLAATPEVAVLSTQPGTGLTELRWQPVGARQLAKPLALVSHLEDATALGATLPGSRTVLVTASAEPKKDLSFASWLWALEPGQPAKVLAKNLSISTRPLVTSQGRVFVQRGVAGEAALGEPRVDALTIDEVDLRTGVLRTVYATKGFTTFLAGEHDGRLLVYVVAPTGASLVAVHPDALSVTVLSSDLGGPARDFVRSGDLLAYAFGDAELGTWRLATIDLSSGARVVRDGGVRDMARLPFFVRGQLGSLTAPGQALLGLEGQVLLKAQGPGYPHLRFVTKGGIAIGLDERPSDFPDAFAANVETQGAVPLVTVKNARLDVAGVRE